MRLLFATKRADRLVLEGDGSDVSFERCWGVTSGGTLLDDLDHLGTDNDTVSAGRGDKVEMSSVVNTETDSEGDSGECSDSSKEFRKGCRYSCVGVGTGDTHLTCQLARLTEGRQEYSSPWTPRKRRNRQSRQDT